MRNRRPHPQQIRSALFGLADARGNNPHGTRETADHEGRRLNAGRYETVKQLDAALDVRARGDSRRMPLGLGEVEPAAQGGGGLLGTALLIALGAGFVYLVMRKDGDIDDAPEPDDVDLPRANPDPALPAAQSQPVVVVVPAAAAATPAAVAPVAVPVVVPPPPRKRRSRAKNPTVSVPVVAVSVTPPEV